MEVPKQPSPITLLQIYHHFRTFFLPEIVQHIFSLQPGISHINDDTIPEDMYIGVYMQQIHEECGHCLAVEVLKQYFLRNDISICDIKDDWDTTFLQYCRKRRLGRIC